MILLRLTLASLFVVSVACLHLWLLLRATHSPVSLEEVIRYWPLAMVAGALPLTPAGMATRDAAFLFLLESDRGSPEVLLATFFYGLTAWVYAFVGVPLLLRSSVLHPKITDTMTNDETRGRQRKAGKGREAGSR
jgi:uncharacterized membrane protein YbhN (UPF0104 family)